MWESGGGATKTAPATIIATGDYRAKPAIYIRKSGTLANAAHALIPVQIGDRIISRVWGHGEDYLEDCQVVKIETGTEEGKPVPIFVCKCIRYENDALAEVEAGENPAYKAVIAKANSYHCREPFYVSPGGRYNENRI